MGRESAPWTAQPPQHHYHILFITNTFTCALSIVLCGLCTFNIVTLCLDFKGEDMASCHTSVIITQNRFIFKSQFLSRHVLQNKLLNMSTVARKKERYSLTHFDIWWQHNPVARHCGILSCHDMDMLFFFYLLLFVFSKIQFSKHKTSNVKYGNAFFCRFVSSAKCHIWNTRQCNGNIWNIWATMNVFPSPVLAVKHYHLKSEHVSRCAFYCVLFLPGFV